MIISGNQIINEISNGNISISPFNLFQLNPASYDLTLNEDYISYNIQKLGYLDSKHKNAFETNKIPDEGLIIYPHDGYLMSTVEIITTNKFLPIINGKSSLGRLFISIHQTAGFGDPGFNGNYTLEVCVKYPVKLYKGMRVAQISFMSILGDITLYNGNYTNSINTIASKSFNSCFK
jgi:dCTP deaminase